MLQCGDPMDVPGTLVWTSDGLVPIEQVRPGDLVWSRSDDGTGVPALKPVLNTITTSPRGLVELTVDEDGDGNPDDTFTGTPSHPFWVEELDEFVPMGELKPGQMLSLVSGTPASVLTVTTLRGPPASHTYNLEVADFHTYYVGTGGVWVHNLTEIPVGWCQIVLSGFEELLGKPGKKLWDAYKDFVTGPMGKKFDVQNWPRWCLRTFNDARKRHFDISPSKREVASWNVNAKIDGQTGLGKVYPDGLGKPDAITLRANTLHVNDMTDPRNAFKPHHIVMSMQDTADARYAGSFECRQILKNFGCRHQ